MRVFQSVCRLVCAGLFVTWMVAPLAADNAEDVRILRGHKGWVGAVAFSPGSRTLATGGADHSAVLWDVATGKERLRCKGHTDTVCAAAFAPDGITLATGSYDGTAKLWDSRRGQVRHTLRGHRGLVLAVAFSPDGKTLATAGLDGVIRLWDPATGQAQGTLRGHRAWVNGLAFAPDGATLASASSDTTVKLWDLATRRERTTFATPAATGEIRSVAFSPNGKLLAAGTRYGLVKVWDVAGGGEKTSIKAHTGDVWSVAFAPDGRTLASGNGDWDRPSQVKLWDTVTWRPRGALAHGGEVLCLTYSPDGRYLAAGSWDRSVRLWRRGNAAAPKAPATGVAAITVPPGFVVEQVAGPPLVEHPMFGCFDDRGRLFVAEAAGKNLKAAELLKDPPNFIRLLVDTTKSGRFDKSTLFADKMTFPMGVLWHDGALYSSSPPSLWRLEDSTGRGVADKRRELVTRFGFSGNAADIHGPFLGPDARLYWTDGRHGHEILGPDGRLMKGQAARIFRCRPDGRDVEVVCGGGMDDPVEIVFTAEGEPLATVDIFIGRPARIDAIIHCVEGGVFPYYEPVLHEFKRTGDLLPAVTNLGWVAPAGLMRYRGTALGKPYQGNLFSAQFNTHKIQRHVLTRAGASFQATNEDFLVSSDPNFHPTDVLEDADGSLLVIDTGGWFRIGCPTSQIAKPEFKGAIYRVRRADALPPADARGLRLAWERLTPRELAALLDDPRFVVRDRAIEQLAKLSNKALQVLTDLLFQSKSERARRNAVWTATRIDTIEARAVVRVALADKAAGIRNVAVHAAGLNRDADALLPLLKLVVQDPSAAVRREAATALGRLRQSVAVPALLAGLRAGGDRFLDHALIYALIAIGDREATRKGLHDASPAVCRGALIALDQMDRANLVREQVIPLLETEDPALRQTVWSLITARPDWAKDVIGLLHRWLDCKDLSANRRDMLRMALLAFAREAAVQDLIDQALRKEQTPLPTRLLLLETMAQMPLDPLPSPWVATLIRNLAVPADQVARQAVATIRSRRGPAFDAALERLAHDAGRPDDLRAAALEAVTPGVATVDPPLFQLLETQLRPEQPPLIRLAAATALGNARLNEVQRARLTKAVAAAGALELSPLLAAYERSGNVEVGRKLIAALTAAPGLPALSSAALRRALQSYPPEIGQAAAPLLKRLEVDAGKQRARLVELEPVLSGGKAARGRKVFFGNRAACSTCHVVQKEGGHVGPDLSKIGGIRSGRDLLESIVFPSASIVRGYEPYVVTTRDGRQHTGIIARESAEVIHLIAADRTETRLARTSVETIEPSRVSIMPQGLDAQLSREEMADLITFLQSLR